MRYEVGRFRRPMRRSTEGQLVGLVDLGDGSTLSLDFTAMSGLDSRFTFSRASTATFINSSVTAATGVPTVNLYSPGTAAAAGTPPAHAIVDCVGSQIVTAQFKAGTSCSMGALWYTI